MTKLKPFLIALLTGIGILAFMLVFMIQVSIDFRIVLVLSCILAFISGHLLAKKETDPLLLALLIILPFGVTFSVIIYDQIPHLISFVLFLYPAAWLGINIKREMTRFRLSLLGGFVIVTLLMATAIVPILLERQTSKTKNEKVDPYTIVDMDGNQINSIDLEGKVVILDFFGTWCRPCIQELEELDEVYNHFSSNKDVVFFVINTAESGDTLEKMNKFINKHNYRFNFAFDRGQSLVNKFNLNGVPYLFVFDKTGNLRYSHIGYNRGESHFIQSVTDIIEGLR